MIVNRDWKQSYTDLKTQATQQWGRQARQVVLSIEHTGACYKKKQRAARKSSESGEGIRAGKVSHLVCRRSMWCLPLFHCGISHVQTGLHAHMFSVLHTIWPRKYNETSIQAKHATLSQTHWHSSVMSSHLTSCLLCLLSIDTNQSILAKTLQDNKISDTDFISGHALRNAWKMPSCRQCECNDLFYEKHKMVLCDRSVFWIKSPNHDRRVYVCVGTLCMWVRMWETRPGKIWITAIILKTSPPSDVQHQLISFTQRPKDTELSERCQKVSLIMVLLVTKKVIKTEWYNDMQKPFLLSWQNFTKVWAQKLIHLVS